ncbi:VOC family protein [Ornithinibacillus sp. 179-J 7C1 HS]|uniref:VOC family protein n=1 Tax=Ornithinibacillus sp. 179-J 7C1 HS TaxID=3142384 RepID=UPI00399F0EAE
MCMEFKGMFVNLPVKDLDKTVEFFSKLGFEFNPHFTDETATCMIIGENMYAMLLTEEKFKGFTNKEIADNSNASEVITALAIDSKESVDTIASKVKVAGGTLDYEPAQNGPMYGTSFHDLDGHQWEIFFMDESEVQ